MSQEQLPPIVQALIRGHLDVWEAYNRLGEAVAKAGPLDARTVRLVKVALAIGAGLQGAVHSHARRGLTAGVSPEELEHVAMLAVTTVGWPRAIAGLSWIQDAFRDNES